jgi:hypothetical protein
VRSRRRCRRAPRLCPLEPGMISSTTFRCRGGKPRYRAISRFQYGSVTGPGSANVSSYMATPPSTTVFRTSLTNRFGVNDPPQSSFATASPPRGAACSTYATRRRDRQAKASM